MTDLDEPTALPAYATPEALASAMGVEDPPAGAARLLWRASRAVDRALLTSRYDPADPDVVSALTQATIEQAMVSREQGDLTGIGSGNRSNFTIGRLSVQRGASAAEQPRQVNGLYPTAWAVLQQAGLTGHGVRTD